MRIAWKLESSDENLASVRYRALNPASELEKFGVRSIFFQGKDDINFRRSFDAVIFVKSFTDHDYLLAEKAKEKGMKVFLDICDNILEEKRGARFFEMATLAEKIVVTTPVLSDLVRKRVSQPEAVAIIEDTFETESSIKNALGFKERQRHDYYFGNGTFWFLRKGVPRIMKGLVARASNPSFTKACESQPLHPSLPVVIWFGRAGVPFKWGMTDLLLVQKELEAAVKKTPFQLVVVSDNYDLFRKSIASFDLETRYIPWSLKSSHEVLKRAKIAIIPNPVNDFSTSKSPNRAVQALILGLNVVATKTKALERLERCIYFDDFASGILRYLTDSGFSKGHLDDAREVIETHYSPSRGAKLWLSILGLNSNHLGAPVGDLVDRKSPVS